MSITTRCGLALLAAMLLTAPGVTQAQDRDADPAADSMQRAVTPVETLRRPVGELPRQGTAANAIGYEKDVPAPVAEPDQSRPRARYEEEPPCGFTRYGC
jgi:hypothetical protein